jgi:hypothetical protein
MDCRAFRKNHVAFVDDLLPGIDMVSMECHLSECAPCARHDMLVRRSLLLFRNVPSIQPSADFAARLDARLRDCRALERMPHVAPASGSWSMISVAAGALVAGYLALTVPEWIAPASDVELAPAVAYEPPPRTPPLANPAVLASVSTGIPLWSAMLLAEQAPAHFAAEFQLAGWTR